MYWFPPLRLLVRTSIALLVMTLMLGPVAVAQEVPRLTFVSLQRTAFAEVFLSGPDIDREEFQNTGQGGFGTVATATLITDFGSGSARADHRSEVTDMGFEIDVDSSFEATHGPATLDVTGRNTFETIFRVTDPLTAILSGTVELTGQSGVQVLIDIVGGSVSVSLVFDDADLDAGEIPISESMDLQPGSLYLMTVSVRAGEPVFDEATDGRARLDLALVAGDEDLDGIPTQWEEFGIDADGDGFPEIDLPALGADPLRKDIFIEVDRQAGSAFPVDQLWQVVDAFANAPVANPNGVSGIRLHTIVDETGLPFLTYTGEADSLHARVAEQKASYFGSPAERNHPDWDNGLREAKRKCFHYAVIGGEFQYMGWGELPGDDFIVTVEPSRYTDLERITAFMHELGHNLGLRHGGHDNIQWKPNYYGIMNYMFAIESRMPEPLVFSLDFSRAQLPTLDEFNLLETDGFGGPSPYYDDKYTAINVAPYGEDPEVAKVRLADGVAVDFDGSTTIDDELVAVDINHLPTVDPTPDQILVGHDDWANISLSFTAGDNFGLGPSAGETTLSLPGGEMTLELFDRLAEILGGPVVSVLDDPAAPATGIRLAAPWPNPIAGQARFAFAVPARAEIELAIYDLRGRRIATVNRSERVAGRHVVSWNGVGDSGRPVPSGHYIAALRVRGAGIDETLARKVTIVR